MDVWLGGGIISRHTKYAPIIGVILLFALISVVCATPFGGVIDSQPYGNLNDNNEVKASAGSKIVDDKTTEKLASTKKTIKVKSAKMSKKDYKKMINFIDKYEDARGYQPNKYSWKSQSSVIYKNDYLDAIDRYNKFLKVNKADPNYVTIFNSIKIVTETEDDSSTNDKKSKNLPLAGKLSGKNGLTILQKYMNKNLNHRDGGPSTFSGVVKSKVGDCWGLSEWAGKQLKANKYKVRIVQGATAHVWNHRWLQINIGGKWINFESSLVTKKYGSKHYCKTCARASLVIRNL
ncbi:hypothetical protein ALNOE001_06330 [Candidatus Methanobinarius endosymbioticus]|uniref:Transglutaminase-like domain-containing protein n=1 Tax=Candidatus Methanobinarius endosymbioticus TaxID=2006182 RepID=A0A366MCF4_9EURY|nr:hypothetical protein ALNOE001_06330 [Candidatus Methanobinarius endosymbioticus]